MEPKSPESPETPDSPESPESADSAVTTCYRHPKVESHVRCIRCDRYICPDCMREASVGHQCVECVKEGARSVRQARTAFGGRITTAPLVTYVLIGLNVLAYLGEVLRPALVDRFQMLGAGLAGPDGGHYLWQDPYPSSFHAEGVVGGEWERLLTGAFLHLPPTEGTFGILHIVMNMVSLWNLGRVVEAQLGRVRFLALYLLSALGGSVLVLLIAPDTPTVGASGAIFGLGAAYYVMARRLGADMRAVNRFIAGLLLWLLISAGLTSWQGHLGGLLAGGLVTLAYAYVPRGPRRGLLQAAACVGLLALLLVLTVGKVSGLTG
ncbi:rhomboid family intramembrane serine protease [Streptomyces avermitilis]|uniref:Membrane protein n=1 Tax=Streptomyces avermitilis (strain ATCC 31267 / DSM 46492 / JCM 5070 / NBRC 14893 / NCIMB 12804 / NRRL 8165 / MA-4680) TaxID=227882 RepID=Q82A67_STRAW|nr:rhomboid family intramembrane serine protease [Streptomyces avermitilis]MYT01743.1 rhomboid family intramembrane serine protease [Streptomyces sp. SID5469]OOV28323.1 rhomboid family intramembrane serine protease [Streptomyces avermitilis]BAC73903.1 putative membrane protein [Streptomyces avermitilis MA-4680 = NBRC 14893]